METVNKTFNENKKNGFSKTSPVTQAEKSVKEPFACHKCSFNAVNNQRLDEHYGNAHRQNKIPHKGNKTYAEAVNEKVDAGVHYYKKVRNVSGDHCPELNSLTYFTIVLCLFYRFVQIFIGNEFFQIENNAKNMTHEEHDNDTK